MKWHRVLAIFIILLIVLVVVGCAAKLLFISIDHFLENPYQSKIATGVNIFLAFICAIAQVELSEQRKKSKGEQNAGISKAS